MALTLKDAQKPKGAPINWVLHVNQSRLAFNWYASCYYAIAPWQQPVFPTTYLADKADTDLSPEFQQAILAEFGRM